MEWVSLALCVRIGAKLYTRMRQSRPCRCRKNVPATAPPGVGNHRQLCCPAESYLSPTCEAIVLMLFRAPVLLLLLTLACSSGPTPDSAPDPDASDQARVSIENRANADMDIYVRRSGSQRIRLGFVGGGETATFALPPTVTAGSTISFEARPIRRSGAPVESEIFGVRRGEVISWSIPPQ